MLDTRRKSFRRSRSQFHLGSEYRRCTLGRSGTPRHRNLGLFHPRFACRRCSAMGTQRMARRNRFQFRLRSESHLNTTDTQRMCRRNQRPFQFRSARRRCMLDTHSDTPRRNRRPSQRRLECHWCMKWLCRESKRTRRMSRRNRPLFHRHLARRCYSSRANKRSCPAAN